jgi:hypothetical protein
MITETGTVTGGRSTSRPRSVILPASNIPTNKVANANQVSVKQLDDLTDIKTETAQQMTQQT